MSPKLFECFSCRDNGCPHTIAYLAGKDDQGKTIQLEDNGTRHTFTRLRSNSKCQRLLSVQGKRLIYLAVACSIPDKNSGYTIQEKERVDFFAISAED